MDDYEDLIGRSGESGRTDVKFNIFRFQDHLLGLIDLVSKCFFLRDWPSSFEALQNLYIDINGFLDVGEKDDLDCLYETANDENNKYLQYNINYASVRYKIKNQSYIPPDSIYFALIAFRFKLMDSMTKHQLLIPQIKKGSSGAGSQG